MLTRSYFLFRSQIMFNFLLIAMIATACNTKKSSRAEGAVNQSATVDLNQIQVGDSIATDNGNYFKFIYLNKDTFNIIWGDHQQRFQSDFFGHWGNEFYLDSSTENVILLTRSCGTSCTQGVILLMRPEDNIKHYEFMKAYDLSHNLVAYFPTTSPNTLIRIENYVTGDFKVVNNLPLCPAGIPIDCFDSIAFSGNNFFIRWQGSNWRSDKHDPREKTIDISNLIPDNQK